MRLLPNTNQPLLRVALVGLCLFYLLASAEYLRLAAESWLRGVIAIGFFLPLSIGLWRLVNVARVVALGIHWALFVLIPVGLLNPFAEMDGVFGHPPIPIWAIFAMVWGIGALNCCAIIALSKFKDQFGPRDYAT